MVGCFSDSNRLNHIRNVTMVFDLYKYHVQYNECHIYSALSYIVLCDPDVQQLYNLYDMVISTMMQTLPHPMC